MKLFASYARKDAARVRPVLEALRERGHEIWMDDAIAMGDDYPSLVVQQLEEADVVLAFLSEVATQSPLVKADIERAFKTKRAADVIPIIVGEGFRHHRLFPFLAKRAQIDVRELKLEQSVDEILRRIEEARPYESAARPETGAKEPPMPMAAPPAARASNTTLVAVLAAAMGLAVVVGLLW